MRERVVVTLKRLAGPLTRLLLGERGVQIVGHRQYVGGMWDEIGRLQFDFLVEQGLKPADCFLDVACGALRGGVHFIRYLDKGNYLGIDREQGLIERGIEQELGREVYADKQPELVISECFEFDQFSKKPQFALALSLFTHLNAEDCRLCLRNLREFVDPGHRFHVTFFEGESDRNPSRSHSLGHFDYTREQMEAFGADFGWKPIYIGDWNHPRDQKMMVYRAE